MHVSSHIRPFTSEATTAQRQPNTRSTSAEFVGLARIAGYPGESRRDNFGRRLAPDRSRDTADEEGVFDEDSARRAEVANALTVTLTTLELSTRLGLGPADKAARIEPQSLSAPDVSGQGPSLDDLLAQALCSPKAAIQG